MALPILDGNQTSTTLATTISGGAHYPNHIIAGGVVTASGSISILDAQVVLGENAPAEAVQVGGYNLADNKLYPIAVDGNGVQSVSGTVTIGNSVTISSLPAISGTVTANVFGVNVNDGSPVSLPMASGEDSFLLGGARLGVQLLQQDGLAVGDGSGILPISGTVTANVFGVDIGGNTFQIPVEVDSSGISDKFIPIGFNDDGDARQVNTNSPLPIQAPNGIAISGTVTANFGGNSRMIGTIAEFGNATTAYVAVGGDGSPLSSGHGRIAVDVIGQSGNSFVDDCVVNNAVRAFGTVTLGTGSAQIGSVTASVTNSITVGSLPVQLSTTTIGGTSRLNVTLSSATTVGATAPSYGNLSGGSDGTNFRAILTDTSGRTVVTGSLTVSQFGSTTIGALPSGALTTRFGSVTTANTAQITSAVTNTSRKYLLCQNNQTGTSAGTVTIGIGFTPTTTQGIQLISGASYTADSFVPTGAVYWLGAVTGANFTILEG